ncbi:hypothetical protein RJZ57_003034 [Blastomyces gilchristii]
MEPYSINPECQSENSQKLHPPVRRLQHGRHTNTLPPNPSMAFSSSPSNSHPIPRSLLMRFHGGGFCEGEAEASMRPFFLELALKHGAAILAPDYRLRPEHEIVDGLKDTRSFWKWVELQMPTVRLQISPGPRTVSEQSTPSLPIKALFLQYPALDLGALCLMPETRVEEAAKALWKLVGKLPLILLYHLKEDELIPWQQTEAWTAKLRKLKPEVPLHLTYQTGEHSFDHNDTMATPWL